MGGTYTTGGPRWRCHTLTHWYTSRRRREKFPDPLLQKAIFFSAFPYGDVLFREVVAGKINCLYNFCRLWQFFANFWPFLVIVTLFSAASIYTVGDFLAIFTICLDFVGISLGTPTIVCRFWGNFGHFCIRGTCRVALESADLPRRKPAPAPPGSNTTWG